MLLKKLFVYTCFLVKEFPLLKELIVIIMTLMKQIPRPKILCTENNSAVLFKERLYIWGDYLRLPGGNMSTNQYRPLQLNLNNIALFTFTAHSTMILSKSNEIFLYGQFDINGKCKSSMINLETRKIICGMIDLMLTTCGKVYKWKDNNGKILLEYLPNLTDVKNIIVCGGGAYVLHFDGNLYLCGITQGRFDSSKNEGPLLSNIVKLSTGHSHYVAIAKNGGVYSWGTSFEGQLGIKSWVYVSHPQKIPISDIVISASCGMGFTILLTQDNKIFGCGSNKYGQLGLGKYAYNVYEPTKINVDNVISVSCGTWHTMVLTLTNQIYVFGSNKYGQLGIESKMQCNLPILLKYPFDSDT